MIYNLKFHPDALQEWNSLSAADKTFFKKKLKQRLENPHIPGSRLSGGHNLYKIKRMRPPLRLTYHVDDQDLVVTALSVGKRDGDVYSQMIKRYEKGNS
jgi:mRNA interferase RelE/StbE